jgi:hypothetical protein
LAILERVLVQKLNEFVLPGLKVSALLVVIARNLCDMQDEAGGVFKKKQNSVWTMDLEGKVCDSPSVTLIMCVAALYSPICGP